MFPLKLLWNATTPFFPPEINPTGSNWGSFCTLKHQPRIQCLAAGAQCGVLVQMLPTNGTLLDWYQHIPHSQCCILCYSYIQMCPTLFHLKHHLGVANCLSLFRAQLAPVSHWFAGYGNHRTRLRDKTEQTVNPGVFITNPTLSTAAATAFSS